MGINQPFTFRPAEEKDAEFIIQLSAQVFSKYGEYDEIVADWFGERAVITEIVLERNNPLGFAMVALEGRKVFGPRGAHLLAIGILPEQQGRGVGTALLAHLEELVRKYKAAEIHLWTGVDNKEAISFFQKAGFTIIGSKHEYYPKGQAALALSKKLAGP